MLRSGGLLPLLLLAAVALPGVASAAHAPAFPPASSPRIAPALTEPDERLAERIVSTPLPPSVFDGAQVVSFYGYPGIPGMGALGVYDPQRAADEVTGVAEAYDALNGDRDVVPALHLIVAIAQATPGADGLYIYRMPPELLRTYIELARERGMLLFLDIQIGWSDPMDEVRRLAGALAEPFVHLALDPEFATRNSGLAPGIVIGSLDAAEVNATQAYLAALVRAGGLPPKLLVLHQFVAPMLSQPEQYAAYREVELTIDMDGYGTAGAKLNNYQSFALAPYAERAAIKLFYDWDQPLMSPQRIQELDRPPDLVIYQ